MFIEKVNTRNVQLKAHRNDNAQNGMSGTMFFIGRPVLEFTGTESMEVFENINIIDESLVPDMLESLEKDTKINEIPSIEKFISGALVIHEKQELAFDYAISIIRKYAKDSNSIDVFNLGVLKDEFDLGVFVYDTEDGFINLCVKSSEINETTTDNAIFKDVARRRADNVYFVRFDDTKNLRIYDLTPN